MDISFKGLKSALKKFDENGKYARCGHWSIANGGYDLYWEIYYKGCPVLQCIAGEVSGGLRPFQEFTEEVENKLIKVVKSVYADLN